ncbi:MAG: 5-methyltetrahydropteroyltriglutamate--homocysteine S-methyltransferase [Clostridiales bacterium]|jgi:5-methyltetrahydropteroyltriglutamate--homocysteine methyltransferase|nr:5-methyltetrahydropteroyltriglutamate--homocysteine S-methyltransferase [Clostridiales bacterium]
MRTSIIGYPRIGGNRELKFSIENYFKGNISARELLVTAKQLRSARFEKQKKSAIDFIPVGDFSLYDGALDTAVTLGVIPKRYRDLTLDGLDAYFAMAKGYQGAAGDVKALSMRKWFNTNYHYIVPEIEDDTVIAFRGSALFDEFSEAKDAGIIAKPVLMGPLTFLKLAKYENKQASDFVKQITIAYAEIIARLESLGAEWAQFDEPILVTDLTTSDISMFKRIYSDLLKRKGNVKVLLQTFFGDIRDAYEDVIALPFDGVGLDFVEGKETLSLVERYGFPSDKTLFAGVINGKNIWRDDYAKTLNLLNAVGRKADNIVISTSCSLLHVPYTVSVESKLPENAKNAFAFAEEKLTELAELSKLADDSDYAASEVFKANQARRQSIKQGADLSVQARVHGLKAGDYTRSPERKKRFDIQKSVLNLPLLPTTTIGSFPQTDEVRANRAKFRKGEITKERYDERLQALTADVVKLQEEIGLDALVHGEFERNDMVEYFGENLNGFLFTQSAWVQSYGTRCVKPPIIFSDISRRAPITVKISKYAQSVASKPMKGMLTGPITILNWSFPREDVSDKEQATQIALAIRDEALDLESAGIRIIQIDEAALREKLPLRKADWRSEYLEWAIPAFRLTHSGVKPETQIHTHMCYSEFQDIIHEIDAMDADVITFEASRSSLAILTAIKESGFETAVGPGVYDIHSARVPSEDEIVAAIKAILEIVPAEKAWINPDCGLKTRGATETALSLKNLVAAAKRVRSGKI